MRICLRPEAPSPVPPACLSCPVHFQPSCAHRRVRIWLQDVVRDRERRPGRALCIGVASMDRLHGSVTFGAFGSMVAMLFGIYDEPLRGDFELDQCGVQRVLERRGLANPGLWRLDPYPYYTL